MRSRFHRNGGPSLTPPCFTVCFIVFPFVSFPDQDEWNHNTIRMGALAWCLCIAKPTKRSCSPLSLIQRATSVKTDRTCSRCLIDVIWWILFPSFSLVTIGTFAFFLFVRLHMPATSKQTGCCLRGMNNLLTYFVHQYLPAESRASDRTLIVGSLSGTRKESR